MFVQSYKNILKNIHGRRFYHSYKIKNDWVEEKHEKLRSKLGFVAFATQWIPTFSSTSQSTGAKYLFIVWFVVLLYSSFVSWWDCINAFSFGYREAAFLASLDFSSTTVTNTQQIDSKWIKRKITTTTTKCQSAQGSLFQLSIWDLVFKKMNTELEKIIEKNSNWLDLLKLKSWVILRSKKMGKNNK